MSNRRKKGCSFEILLRVGLIIGVIAFLCVCVVNLYTQRLNEKRGYYGINENAKVTDLTVCYGPSPADGKPLIPNGPVANNRDIYACGYLESNWPIRLDVLWRECETGAVIYDLIDHGRGDPIFHPGYFYSKLPINYLLLPGRYCIDVIHARRTLATLEFVVQRGR